MDSELERIWKEAVVAYFRALSQHLPGGNMENHDKPVRICGLQAQV
jgi:hypothetical protein